VGGGEGEGAPAFRGHAPAPFVPAGPVCPAKGARKGEFIFIFILLRPLKHHRRRVLIHDEDVCLYTYVSACPSATRAKMDDEGLDASPAAAAAANRDRRQSVRSQKRSQVEPPANGPRDSTPVRKGRKGRSATPARRATPAQDERAGLRQWWRQWWQKQNYYMLCLYLVILANCWEWGCGIYTGDASHPLCTGPKCLVG
jgi:hypothetical protein